MCFSATASFTAGAALAAIGTGAIVKATTGPQKLLATAPLLFSVQQLSEGFLWLSFTHQSFANLHTLFMYTFLAFAQVIWPLFVPLVVFVYETIPLRKKILMGLLSVGACTSSYLLYCVLTYPVSATVGNHHINYTLNFPYYSSWYTGIPYMLAILSPLASGLKRIRYLGILLLLSFLLSTLLYDKYLISVWCYFAAIISSYVLYIILQEQKEEPTISHTRVTHHPTPFVKH